jgi:hypothetical protein
MKLRLGAVLLASALVAALPVQAGADETSLHAAMMEAKGVDSDGPNSPGGFIVSDGSTTIGGQSEREVGHSTGVQVNDPKLDHIVTFPNVVPAQRPFELSIQSETSMASFGDNVVVGFNNSADQIPLGFTSTGVTIYAHRFLSGVGTSHDAGRSWTETSLPPIPGSPFTFGDPAVTVDRTGNFFYASLGADASGNSLVFVGKSTDGGTTFHSGVTVALDPGVDKEWIGAGPDPINPGRDNVYVTWTSFKFNAKGQTIGSQLMLGKSTDGGQTWTTSTLFAPVDNGVESSFIQFSNTVVDRTTGRLYIPFLHFSDSDADFIKVLISDDGGQTFHFSNFNVRGAPTTAFPNVTPGTISDCGVNGGFRLTLHAGSDLGGGRFSLPVFRNATRLITQPSTVAQDGEVFIAFNSSTSAISGDPNSRSEIRMLFSPDGGSTWQGPVTVARASNTEPQHVHPAISVNSSGSQVAVGYYSQLANGKLQVNATTASLEREHRSFRLEDRQVTHLGPANDLIPSNNPLDPKVFGPNFTTNYDRTIRPCYDIGEYMTTTRTEGKTLFSYGDNRNSWTSPPQSPAAGTHSQPDVFANRLGGDD